MRSNARSARGQAAFVGLALLALASCSAGPGKARATADPPADPPATTSTVAASDEPEAAVAAGETESSGDPSPSTRETDGPGTTPDPALLTCQDVVANIAPGLCGALESAPRAAGDSAATRLAVSAWEKLEPSVRALSGRETALAVLAPTARLGEGDDATPLPPAAFICPGAPPTVYVPATLLDLVGAKKRYPVDFLAFVLGHELGHRMNDLTADGCQLAAFQRPGRGFQEEELADARSAFFIANAGYSASDVAREDMVSTFLEAEFKLGRPDTKSRRDSLLTALRQFDSYEAAYQTALAVALTGEMEAADRLLSWTDERIAGNGVPLPELRVVRAITRINRAASMAPWTADLGLPVGIEGLRCVPLHPGHSGLWEEPGRRVRSPDLERGRRLLLEARQLLDEAELRGATPFTVAVARTCAALYLADAPEAERQHKRARSLMPRRAASAIRDAMQTNGALVEFLRYARTTAAPDFDDRAGRQRWATGLRKAVGGKRAPQPLQRLADAVAAPDADSTAGDDASVACSGSTPTQAPTLPALPASGPAHGKCPTGYDLVFALPDASASAQTGSNQGITSCKSSGDGTQLFTVRLASTTSPPLRAVEHTIGPLAPPPELADLNAWSCGCEAISRTGVADTGEVVFRVRCPRLGLARGALLVAPRARSRVVQVIRHTP